MLQVIAYAAVYTFLTWYAAFQSITNRANIYTQISIIERSKYIYSALNYLPPFLLGN